MFLCRELQTRVKKYVAESVLDLLEPLRHALIVHARLLREVHHKRLALLAQHIYGAYDSLFVRSLML